MVLRMCVCVCVPKVKKTWDILYTDQSEPQSNPSRLIIRLPSITTDNNQLAHSSSPFFSCSWLTPE